MTGASHSGTRPNGPTFKAAGFRRRLLAALIDTALVFGVAWILGKVGGSILGIDLPDSRIRGIDYWLDIFFAKEPGFIAFIVLWLAIAFVYLAVFHIVWSRTPGMRAVKCRVIDQYGANLTVQPALIRALCYGVSLASFLAGFFWILIDGKRRSFHDILSQTHVVRA